MVSSSVSQETHYVRDASGNLMATYENKIAKEFVIYGSSRLGIYNGNTSEGKRTLGNKKYELFNHLGNVLSVISDNKIGIDNIGNDLIADYYEPYIISESDYYPYGMTMEKRSFASSEYRFGMNGQEKSTELGEDSYTAEFWQYDSRSARRWNNDPKPTTSISVYAAFANNPIMFSDHLGDTAVVKWGNSNEARYVGGKWIDATTRAAINVSGVADANAKQQMSDYEILNTINTYSPVTTAINAAINNVILIPSNTTTTGVDAPQFFRDLNSGIANPDVIVMLGSPTLDSRLFAGGDNRNDTYMTQGHELGHVWSMLKHKNDKYVRPIPGMIGDISMSEIDAMFWENILRVAAGYGMREHYDVYTDPNTNQDVYQLPVSIRAVGTYTKESGASNNLGVRFVNTYHLTYRVVMTTLHGQHEIILQNTTTITLVGNNFALFQPAKINNFTPKENKLGKR